MVLRQKAVSFLALAASLHDNISDSLPISVMPKLHFTESPLCQASNSQAVFHQISETLEYLLGRQESQSVYEWMLTF